MYFICRLVVQTNEDLKEDLKEEYTCSDDEIEDVAFLLN